MRLLLLQANSAQEPQPADAAAAVLSVRAEGRRPPADNDSRGAPARAVTSRRRARDVASPARKSRDTVLSWPEIVSIGPYF